MIIVENYRGRLLSVRTVSHSVHYYVRGRNCEVPVTWVERCMSQPRKRSLTNLQNEIVQMDFARQGVENGRGRGLSDGLLREGLEQITHVLSWQSCDRT